MITKIAAAISAACLLSTSVCAETSQLATQRDVVWTFTFSHIIPNRPDVSATFCEMHSPNILVAAIGTILQKGSTAKNGVTLKFNRYDQTVKRGLYFADVTGQVSGVENGKKWQMPIYIHEQKLTPNGSAVAVWSDRDCKGRFTSDLVHKIPAPIASMK